MAEQSATTEEQGDEGMGFLTQLKTFTDGFMKLRTNKEKMSKTIEEQEKKIKKLEIESEKKSSELKALKEERRQLLTDLERSRFEVVRLNEENVSLKRELEKYRDSSAQTPNRRVTRRSKNKEKEKKDADPDDVLPPDLAPEAQLTETEQTETNTTATSDLNGAPTNQDEAWQALSTSDAQSLVTNNSNVSTPQRKQLTPGKGMAIVYKTPDSRHSGYKTSVPLEVLQQEAAKGKDLDKCREVVESGVLDNNFEHAGSISVVVEEYIGPDIAVNGSVNDQVINSESAGTINVVVEEYVAPDNGINATVNSLVDGAVAYTEMEQNGETGQNIETEQTEKEGGSNPQGEADEIAIDNDAANPKNSKEKPIGEATPNLRTNRKSSRKSTKKKKGRKSVPSKTAEENSQACENDKTPKESNKDKGQTPKTPQETNNDNYQTPKTRSRGRTEKETFLSNMNLSSSKTKMKIRLRSSSKKEIKTYPARSGRKRKAMSPIDQVPEKAPVHDSEKGPELQETVPEPDAGQESNLTDLKAASRVKFENLNPKTETDLSLIYNFDMEENVGKDQSGDVPGPDIIVDPSTEEDFQGVYFCSECNIGFKNESIFNRHIQFRHAGAGLPSDLPSDLKSHAGVQILPTGLKKLIKTPTSENSSVNENTQFDENEQTALQNGSVSAAGAMSDDNAGRDSPATMPAFVIPKLKKEFPRPLFVVKKEQGGPPVLKKEGSAEPEPKKLTNVKRHACLLCDKKFASGVGLRAHVNKHNGVRPYECTICHMSFFAKSDRNKHVKITHEAVKNHFCLLCGKGFTTLVYLNHHLNNHSQERKFGCEECGKRFKQKPHLDKHIQLIHRNERTHVCTTCGKAFGTTYGLKSHQTVHTGEKMFSCDTCGKSFGNKGYLLKHQMYHTGEKKYMCIHCKKCFYLSTDLQRHMQIHTNEKGFACTQCEYKTNMKANLKVHMLKHSGIRYKCSVCGKKLTSKSSLVKHSQLHEEMAMYEVTDPDQQQEPETEQELQEPELLNQLDPEQGLVSELEHQPVELMQESELEQEELSGEPDQEPDEGHQPVELRQEQPVELRQELELEQEQLGEPEQEEQMEQEPDQNLELGQDPQQELGQDPQQELGQDLEQDSEQEMGQDPEQEMGQDPEQEMGKELGLDPEQELGQDPEQEPDNYTKLLTVPVDKAVATAQ